ncbi:DUF3325 domain-containing protein [Methylobacterium sp. E-041]|uniref:DUF3325 domain-containing protein n=1 Tax=unclassified Methylobacterium TaxID=2615210 RepID=UPI001FBBBD6D|nr:MULTISPECIES: DUF3325 domain-containing protein [unclassified Methylobacterium]MCJ2009949.1 DUF3325 domain-containing protein [Methylobacterium sp. J-092]MCJ2041605.1 DUF3325 domain-containing protein [Methylobacterium sp. J-059]MCJ2107947.1 DUF3325 domain-containing protein [Methylobacterium sp. E-041]MCJ2113831.1 DUF3325 domain-containing protein [Methylobacterium sp. E-025]
MTAIVVGLNLALCFAGLSALALSLDRHHRDAFLVRPGAARARTLRIAGWAGIGLSFVAAVALEGWNFGPVQWIGALTGAALLVVAFLSYRPGWLRPAALLALPIALVALPLALNG